MGVAWVGILPRQGVWVVCPAKAIDFWGDFFGSNFDVLIVVITLIWQISHR